MESDPLEGDAPSQRSLCRHTWPFSKSRGLAQLYPRKLHWVGALTEGRRLRIFLRVIAGGRRKAADSAGTRLGDERLVRLTSGAATKIRTLLDRQGRSSGVLRVQVLGGGCSGLQYKMDLQDAPANRDILVESQGVRVVVDPKSALYVTGSELDYVDALQDGGFKVNNPNAATTCSCGESFSA